MQPRSLYIHVPFCARRCAYCDFAVEATRLAPVEDWLEAIATEARLLSEASGWASPLELDTLYVGGGTPSLLGAGAMTRLAGVMAPYASWNADTEWTCEANPETFTRELARDWKAAGVNRISLGAQTFHSESLRWMGRLHGAEGPVEALAAARAAGFDNVSIDLIFGLPERLGRNWGDDLTRVRDLGVEHVSLYGLTAEPATPLGHWVRDGREALADEDRYAGEYLLAHAELTAAGFEHYEVSNFGRPGKRSRHNVVYWTGAPYAALGPGSHSFDPPMRRWNLRSWSQYRATLGEGRLPREGEERIDPEAEALERSWLALRTDAGYSLCDTGGRVGRLRERWIAAGLAHDEVGRIRLTARGWLILDELAVKLAEAVGVGRLEGVPGD